MTRHARYKKWKPRIGIGELAASVRIGNYLNSAVVSLGHRII